MANELNFEGWVCPLPLRDHPNIIMGHGGGGKLSAELVEHLFLPAFKNETLDNLGDSAVINLQSLISNLQPFNFAPFDAAQDRQGRSLISNSPV